MGRLEGLDPFRRRQQANVADVLGPRLLQAFDRRRGGVCGGQHGVGDDDQTLGDVARYLEVVLDGRQRIVIAVDADMPDRRLGQQFEHAFEQAVAGAQDRHQAGPRPDQRRCLHRGQRRLDRSRRQLQVARHLIGQQNADLAQQPPEFGRLGLLAPHGRQLVLHQRVRDDVDRVRQGHRGLPYSPKHSATAAILPHSNGAGPQAGARSIHEDRAPVASVTLAPMIAFALFPGFVPGMPDAGLRPRCGRSKGAPFVI